MHAGRLPAAARARSAGPGFRDFKEVVPRPGTYTLRAGPRYSDPSFNRRTHLSDLEPRRPKRYLLDAFDCPDPSVDRAQRAVTTTPLQALATLNNAFTLRMADANRRAGRATKPAEISIGQIERAYRWSFGRDPDPDGANCRRAASFVEHGLAALARPCSTATSSSMSIDRREFFSWVSRGLGGAALASLLPRRDSIAHRRRASAADPPPHHSPQGQTGDPHLPVRRA